MNTVAILFVLANAIAVSCVPKRWAPVPLLIGACYMTLGQSVDIGPFTFRVVRILIAVGLVRVWLRGEKLPGGLLKVDWLMLAGSAWAMFTAAFRDDPGAALVYRMGQFYDQCGIYFLIRIFCTSTRDVIRLARVMGLLLVPVAIEMLYEQATVHNLFSVLGGVPENPAIRQGRIRAQGPFMHPILAGTVGAATIPFMVGLWQTHRKTAVAGMAACGVMILTVASSGPIMSAVVAVIALFMWKARRQMRLIRWCAVGTYILLDLVMKAPAYYLIARARIVGGSTGWHRAYLIEQAFKHLSEWWLVGTDVTRHWMPTGLSQYADHSDITNYYLQFGVLAGLPRMLLFIACLWVSFRYVGESVDREERRATGHAFLVWALGASLATHAVTGLSVSYFDQSYVFLYLTMAAIVSVRAAWNSPDAMLDDVEHQNPASELPQDLPRQAFCTVAE